MPDTPTGGQADRASQDDARSPGTPPELVLTAESVTSISVDCDPSLGRYTTTLTLRDGRVIRTNGAVMARADQTYRLTGPYEVTAARTIAHGDMPAGGMNTRFRFTNPRVSINGVEMTQHVREAQMTFTPAPQQEITAVMTASADVTFTVVSTGATWQDRAMRSDWGPDRVEYTGRWGHVWTMPRDWQPGQVVRVFDFNTQIQACRCYRCRATRGESGMDLDQVNAWEQAEMRRRHEADEERRRAAEERQRRYREAEERAEETLRSILTPTELKRYDRSGDLIVKGQDDRKYRIIPGTYFNVKLLASPLRLNNELAELCCHPQMRARLGEDSLPDRDAHVAQILWLRHDLVNFWKTANISWRDDRERRRYVEGAGIYAEIRGLTDSTFGR